MEGNRIIKTTEEITLNCSKPHSLIFDRMMVIINKHTSLVGPVIVDGNEPFCVNSSTIYCSIIFAHCTESTQFIECLYEVREPGSSVSILS
jgi:hypothetical protein